MPQSTQSKSDDEYIGHASPLGKKVLRWFGITSARESDLDKESK